MAHLSIRTEGAGPWGGHRVGQCGAHGDSAHPVRGGSFPVVRVLLALSAAFTWVSSNLLIPTPLIDCLAGTRSGAEGLVAGQNLVDAYGAGARGSVAES